MDELTSSDLKIAAVKRTLFVSVFFIITCFYLISRCGAEEKTMQLTEELTITEIEAGVYLITHCFPWPANSLLVKVSATDLILVDTPWENQATAKLVDWIRQKFKACQLTVINTHFHRDNLGGNGYILSQNIPIYGSDLTVTLLSESKTNPRDLPHWMNKPEYEPYFAVFEKTELKPPDHIFNIRQGLVLKKDQETIEVYYPGPGHSPDNVVVYFYNRKLLFGGCIIRSLRSNRLGYTGTANLKEWPDSLRKVLQKFSQCKIVVPGHGEAGDNRLFGHTIAILKSPPERR
ncbi:subclass B1 metallo-beta-lactamase [candidate division CSSED10-310 bacterium]|uniref:beta-lactamase n=1 Tax=candidate division CSSED10-310 bacterium TaxID=2855610 RepID=A0ABV6Z5H8_UNCC1